jgi:hypothetical protein
MGVYEGRATAERRGWLLLAICLVLDEDAWLQMALLAAPCKIWFTLLYWLSLDGQRRRKLLPVRRSIDRALATNLSLQW